MTIEIQFLLDSKQSPCRTGCIYMETLVLIFPGKGYHFVNSLQMYHSQRLNETPPTPWIICESGGKVFSAHCNCMAGLGESCSHAGAVLFAVEAATRIRDSKTVTQEKAYWLLPAAHREIQ